MQKPNDMNWFQIAGHPDKFKLINHNTLMKKTSVREIEAFRALTSMGLKYFLPELYRIETLNDAYYIKMENLLSNFTNPAAMDCKLGTRATLQDCCLDEEYQVPRKDLYETMLRLDSTQLTRQHHEQLGVNKVDFMQMRARVSSSAQFGFRISGYKHPLLPEVKFSDTEVERDTKQIRSKQKLNEVFGVFLESNTSLAKSYRDQLKSLYDKLKSAEEFKSIEIVSSSLLLVHELAPEPRCRVWMIDFDKTQPIPHRTSIVNGTTVSQPICQVNHETQWDESNYEDGYLFGLKNLISFFEISS